MILWLVTTIIILLLFFSYHIYQSEKLISKLKNFTKDAIDSRNRIQLRHENLLNNYFMVQTELDELRKKTIKPKRRSKKDE